MVKCKILFEAKLLSRAMAFVIASDSVGKFPAVSIRGVSGLFTFQLVTEWQIFLLHPL